MFDVFGATGQGSIQTKKADGTKRRTIFAPGRFRPSVPVFSPNGEKSLADDASYTDPAYEVRGKEEIASHIGRSLSGEAYGGAAAGARIPISSGVDQHHGLFRFSWVMVDPQDQLLLEGMDFVELAGDGRLQRITGFFGAFPPLPESWPEHLVWRSE